MVPWVVWGRRVVLSTGPLCVLRASTSNTQAACFSTTKQSEQASYLSHFSDQRISVPPPQTEEPEPQTEESAPELQEYHPHPRNSNQINTTTSRKWNGLTETQDNVRQMAGAKTAISKGGKAERDNEQHQREIATTKGKDTHIRVRESIATMIALAVQRCDDPSRTMTLHLLVSCVLGSNLTSAYV